MSEFNWDDHKIEDPNNIQLNDFNWDDHKIETSSVNSSKGFGAALTDLSKGPSSGETGYLERGLLGGLQKIDEYTGAPVRKFVTEKVTGEPMGHAPSGAEQAEMLGASTKSYNEVYGIPKMLGGGASPADIYGIGLEAIQDPFLLGSLAYGGLKKGVQAAKGLFTPVENIGEAAANASSKAFSDVGAMQAGQAAAESSMNAKSGVTFSGGDVSVENSGKLFNIKKPESLEELRNWVPDEGQGQLQSFRRLGEIEADLPDLKTKPLQYHYEMLSNPKKMKELKLQFENLPTQDAQKIAIYNQNMVDESLSKATKEIENISGSAPLKIEDAGHDFISTVKDKYNAEKSSLGPMFEKFKETSRPLSKTEAIDIQIAIGENSKIGSLISVDPKTGGIVFKPNSPKTGLSSQEYSVVKEVLGDFNGSLSFKDIQNIREHMRKTIDYSNPHATEEIGKVRSILLDQLEFMASKSSPEMRDVFKSYAINERTRESLEKIIGGKIESLDAMYSANPDKVVSKIFANPNYAGIAKEYIGDDKFNEIVGSYLKKGLDESFDRVRGYEPSKLRNFLTKNRTFMNRYVNPDTSKRLLSIADSGYMAKRFLDEVNPSGTAASLISGLEPTNFIQKISKQGITGAVTSEVAGLVSSKVKQKNAIKAFNESMSGASASTSSKVKQSILNKYKGSFSNLKDTNVDYINNFQRGSATGRGLMKDEDNEKQNPPDQTSIMNKIKGSPYESLLNNALKNGGQKSFAAANYVLKNRDQKYRNLFEEV